MTRVIWTLLAATAVALAGCNGQPAGSAPKTAAAPADTAPFNSTDITGANFGKALALPDQDGKARTLADFKGKVTVVFFGYTQCPDVCPTTMAELAEIKRSLGADGARLQAVFVTVDPERDTPALLKAYMAGFDPSFIGLRGTPEQTKAAAQEFKVFYAKVPGRTPDSYTIDHTAGTLVFDPQGRLRLFVSYGMAPDKIAADVKKLLT